MSHDLLAARIALLALALTAVGCSDTLVDGAYRGEPLIQIQGSILTLEGEDNPTPPGANLRAAIFWTAAASEGLEVLLEVEELDEQGVEARSILPARYSITVFNPPPEGVVDREDDEALAVAVILIYADEDGDGNWDVDDEPLFGGAREHVLVYTPKGVDDEELGGELSPGYHLMFIDFEQACEEEGELADMVPVEGEDGLEVNLFLTEDMNGLLPDIDCDGIGDDFDDDDHEDFDEDDFDDDDDEL